MKTKETIQTATGPQIIRCYDSGPDKGADRYTVYYMEREKWGYVNGSLEPGQVNHAGQPLYPCYGMSGAPFHPQGIAQHSTGVLGKHNGKRVAFASLPADCQRAVMNDFLPEPEECANVVDGQTCLERDAQPCEHCAKRAKGGACWNGSGNGNRCTCTEYTGDGGACETCEHSPEDHEGDGVKTSAPIVPAPGKPAPKNKKQVYRVFVSRHYIAVDWFDILTTSDTKAKARAEKLAQKLTPDARHVATDNGWRAEGESVIVGVPGEFKAGVHHMAEVSKNAFRPVRDGKAFSHSN